MGKHKGSTSRGGRGKGAKGSRRRPRPRSLCGQSTGTGTTTSNESHNGEPGKPAADQTGGDRAFARRWTRDRALNKQPPPTHVNPRRATSHPGSKNLAVWRQLTMRARERAVTTGNHNLGG
ncbi:uncharacterized protein LOC121428844 [Lytechinus variegatus]|uniref:uncharacterized protein LOC121428844 n=1 Tax=Lytechinus variegatus TaxID=7654 RepID=UPI001BB0FB09|nr:uncharacterized protein LOC121428844 [Lytechinus variegatus]